MSLSVQGPKITLSRRWFQEADFSVSLTYAAAMLADAVKMEAMKQGTDPSRPTAQMRGSTCGTLSLNDLDRRVPRNPPRIPVTSVTTPKP